MALFRIPIVLSAFLMASVHAAEPVSVVRFADIAVNQVRQASARVESLDRAVLASELTARVIDIPVRVGERVDRGALLLQLDRADYELQRDAARARLDLASAALDMAQLRAERARRLAPERFVSDDQLLEAETRLRQAQAERAAAEVDLARAELMLGRTTVTSPYEAVIAARLIGVGALAAPATPLLEIVATDAREVVAGLAVDQVEGLRQASDPELLIGSERHPLRLLRVSPIITPGARQREVRLEFLGEGAPPGSEGEIEWLDPRPVLPARFIQRRGNELGVLVLATGDASGPMSAAWLALPGADAGRGLQIELDPDLRLIDRGRERLQPGDPVRLESADASLP
ncbi:efflux RND transporter periplasmic adaptor subunit [Wenzhouxiangella marina]|uniref:Uncharacterized protein n=1 Tax=Wenzhouxiangella marina TaxID=1579979 RepID=A0A0K0XY73_9GAMM|nr:efflux RND transporter periplasmic adaptor subunit [Wenzhouxiangella marina]AKS42577.1 hypothetical protein WM2015_2214 [Wenzhouxiangella marina]MBB6085641.1 RND family efflux transporter MFP subunit [Wenzhouxiangella marina]